MNRVVTYFRRLVFLVAFGLSASTGAWSQNAVRQGPPVPSSFCIGKVEQELYLALNKFRKENNLPPIPLSASLSYVAALHAKDLFLNHPDQGNCNPHSWSAKGFWAPFCYPRDENKKNSVWDKPRELTRYPGKAFEIVYSENNPLIRDTILMVWQGEDYFRSFLLNTGKWLGKPWNAIGIAVYENYACAWFGESVDPEGGVSVCGAPPVVKPSDTARPVVPPPVKPAVPKKSKPSGKQAGAKKDSIPSVKKDTLSNRNDSVHVPVPKQAVVAADSTRGVYYIIVKTNLSSEAAAKFVSELQGIGYAMAKVLNQDGKVRISAFESPDKTVVTAKLREIKRTYRDAWLLKR